MYDTFKIVRVPYIMYRYYRYIVSCSQLNLRQGRIIHDSGGNKLQLRN